MVTSWPLPVAGRVDMGLVEDLARLQLAARRLGCRIQLRHADPQLSDLLLLSGLADILPPDPPDPTEGCG